jgi:hypothetical protein
MVWFSGVIPPIVFIFLGYRKGQLELLPTLGDSCKELFKKMETLPLQSQFIFSLLLFVVNNRDQFKSNSEIYGRNTRHTNNLHYPICNLTVFQKGVYYFGIKVFKSSF